MKQVFIGISYDSWKLSKPKITVKNLSFSNYEFNNKKIKINFVIKNYLINQEDPKSPKAQGPSFDH